MLQCRACLNCDESEYYDLRPHLEWFNQLTSLFATMEDELPSVLCPNCTNAIESAYKFAQMARQSDGLQRVEVLAANEQLGEIETYLTYNENMEEEMHPDVIEELCDYEEENENTLPFSILESSVESGSGEPTQNECAPKSPSHDTKHKLAEHRKQSITEIESAESLDVNTLQVSQQVQDEQTCAERKNDSATEYKKSNTNARIAFPKELMHQSKLKHRMELQDHNKSAANDGKVYVCSYCLTEFKNQKTFNKHEKLHDSDSPNMIYVCNECERPYNTQQLLEQHRRHAHKERNHICSICGNAFKLKNQLVNHMKLHLEKNITCSYCDKKYARLFDLNVHIRTHTGELPFECHMCEKRFAIKVRLTYHLQKHLGIKHPCKECGAEFNSKQKLKSHSYKHTGMPYRCDKCDWHHGFSNRDLFKKHLHRAHNSFMSDQDLIEMFQRYTGKMTRVRTIDEMELKNNIQMLPP